MFAVGARPKVSACAPKAHLSQASLRYGVFTPVVSKSPLPFTSSRTRSESAFESVWSYVK
jgi:hypothetical protein